MKRELLRMEHIFIYKLNKPVLDDFRLSIFKGEIVNLIGLSGAGKTLLLNLLAGNESFNKGKIYYDGVEYVPNMKMPQKGSLFCIRQESMLINSLSVAENLFVICKYGFRKFVISKKNLFYKTKLILSEYIPEVKPETLVKNLTRAECHIIELLKAVVNESKLIVIDDIMESYNLMEQERFIQILFKLRENGISILYESHKPNRISKLADRIIIMRKGKNVKTIFNDEYDEYSENLIYNLLVGNEIPPLDKRMPSIFPQEILDVNNIYGEKYIRGLSFKLNKGEILGVYDIENKANKELANILTGQGQYWKGSIYLDGSFYSPPNILFAIKRGIGFLPSQLAEKYLFKNMDFADNLFFAVMKKTSKGLLITDKKVLKFITKEYINKVGIKEQDKKEKIKSFDAYIMKNVLLYRWILYNPKVLVCSEPFAMADIIMKKIIYSGIDEAAKSGIGIIISSSELTELLYICDKIIVFGKGKILGTYSSEEIKNIKTIL